MTEAIELFRRKSIFINLASDRIVKYYEDLPLTIKVEEFMSIIGIGRIVLIHLFVLVNSKCLYKTKTSNSKKIVIRYVQM